MTGETEPQKGKNMSLLLHFSRRYPEKHYTIKLPEVKDMKEACKISADVINAHEAYSDLYINQLDKTIAGISDEHGIAITALKEDGKTWIDRQGNIVNVTRKIFDDIAIPNEWLNAALKADEGSKSNIVKVKRKILDDIAITTD